MRRRFPWLALGLALILSLMAQGPAAAHAFLSRSDPEDGAVLAQFPSEVRLWFSEPVVLEFTAVELVNSAGEAMPVVDLRVDAADPALVVVTLPSQPPNAYRLTWRTLSADDVHPSTGTLVFGVQQAAEVAASTVAPPSSTEVLWRWINFVGLAGLLGGLAMALVVLPPAKVGESTLTLHRAMRLKFLWLALGGSLLALVGGVGLLWAQAQTLGEAQTASAIQANMGRLLTDTAYGGRWWQRQGLLLELAIAVGVLRRRPVGDPVHGSRFSPRAVELLVFGPFALLLVVTQALNGHAAGVEGASWIPIALEALHLLAASLWAGGLLALVIIIAPLLGRDLTISAWAWVVLRRFGAFAAGCVAVLAITGLYALGQQVASLDALVTTAYGQTLIVKVGGLLGVGLIGLLNSAMLHSRVARLIRRLLFQPATWHLFSSDYLGHTVTLETLGLGALLLAAACLGATPPARGPEFDPPPEETAPTTFTTEADDLLVTLSIKPNRPGQNFISLGVFNTRRPPPAPIEQVTVQFQPPDQPTLLRVAEPQSEAGRYQIVGEVINAAGQWQLVATIRRTGLADTAVAVPWTVFPPLRSAQRPILLSNRPLTSWLNLFAIGLAVSIGGATIWWRRTKRKPKPT